MNDPFWAFGLATNVTDQVYVVWNNFRIQKSVLLYPSCKLCYNYAKYLHFRNYFCNFTYRSLNESSVMKLFISPLKLFKQKISEASFKSLEKFIDIQWCNIKVQQELNIDFKKLNYDQKGLIIMFEWLPYFQQTNVAVSTYLNVAGLMFHRQQNNSRDRWTDTRQNIDINDKTVSLVILYYENGISFWVQNFGHSRMDK